MEENGERTGNWGIDFRALLIINNNSCCCMNLHSNNGIEIKECETEMMGFVESFSQSKSKAKPDR